MMKAIVLFCSAVGAQLLTGPASAGRPLQTEEAGVIEAGACEVEGAALRLRRNGAATARGNTLQFGCGIGVNTQIALAASRERDSDTAHGYALVGKTRLWTGAGEGAPELTLAWGAARVRLAGERWRHAESALRLVYSGPAWDDTTLHVNLGHARDELNKMRSTPWGVALEHGGFALAGVTLAPMAEVFGDDREAPWWNLGLRVTLVPARLFVDVSCGRQFSGQRPTLATAGFKLAF